MGLPEGQMGNSEVGHTNIGAGRVVYQDLPRITNAVKDGSFFENPVYVKAMDDAAKQPAARCMCSASSPTAACTAISTTSSRYSRWPSAAA